MTDDPSVTTRAVHPNTTGWMRNQTLTLTDMFSLHLPKVFPHCRYALSKLLHKARNAPLKLFWCTQFTHQNSADPRYKNADQQGAYLGDRGIKKKQARIARPGKSDVVKFQCYLSRHVLHELWSVCRCVAIQWFDSSYSCLVRPFS